MVQRLTSMVRCSRNGVQHPRAQPAYRQRALADYDGNGERYSEAWVLRRGIDCWPNLRNTTPSWDDGSKTRKY